MMKKFLAMTMILAVMLPLFCLGASAAVQWDNTLSIIQGVSGYKGYGEAYINITGKSGVTAIDGTVTVYIQNGSNWDYVTTNTCSSTDNALYLYAEFTSIKGCYYRADYTIHVYKGTNCETISDSVYGTSN